MAEKKVFDVAKPGSSVPPSNTKNVIVSNRPVVADSTIAAGDEDTDKPAEEKVAVMHHELTIEPLEEDKKEAETSQEEKDGNEEKKPEEEAATKEETAADTAETAEADKSDTAEENEEAKPKPEDKAKAEAEAKHREEVVSLISSQKYFLPINQVEKRKNRRMVILGGLVCVILALAWVDVAIDAGIITNTFNLPHTHFFALKK